MSQTTVEWSRHFVQSNLSSSSGRRLLLTVKGNDAMLVADVLDEALESGDLNPPRRTKYIAILRKICGNWAILPRSHVISDGLEITSKHPVESGGFADVFKGTYKGVLVAVKVFKRCPTDLLIKMRKLFYKEAVIWRRLSNPNVLSFLGSACPTIYPLSLISVWMDNGDIDRYVREYPEANRLSLLVDVAKGVYYLHSCSLVHGDLKGGNILINADHHAVLADFGLMTIVSDSGTGTYIENTSVLSTGTLRWMSPELIYPEHFDLPRGNPTKASDVYALGMVLLEVLTGKLPFNTFRPETVTIMVVSGKRPPRPDNSADIGLFDNVWEVMQLSWQESAPMRPDVKEILSTLDEASPRWNPRAWIPNDVGSDIDADSYFGSDSDLDDDSVFDYTTALSNLEHSRLRSTDGQKIGSNGEMSHKLSQGLRKSLLLLPESHHEFTTTPKDTPPASTARRVTSSRIRQNLPVVDHGNFLGKFRNDLLRIMKRSPSERATYAATHIFTNSEVEDPELEWYESDGESDETAGEGKAITERHRHGESAPSQRSKVACTNMADTVWSAMAVYKAKSKWISLLSRGSPIDRAGASAPGRMKYLNERGVSSKVDVADATKIDGTLDEVARNEGIQPATTITPVPRPNMADAVLSAMSAHKAKSKWLSLLSPKAQIERTNIPAPTTNTPSRKSTLDDVKETATSDGRVVETDEEGEERTFILFTSLYSRSATGSEALFVQPTASPPPMADTVRSAMAAHKAKKKWISLLSRGPPDSTANGNVKGEAEMPLVCTSNGGAAGVSATPMADAVSSAMAAHKAKGKWMSLLSLRRSTNVSASGSKASSLKGVSGIMKPEWEFKLKSGGIGEIEVKNGARDEPYSTRSQSSMADTVTSAMATLKAKNKWMSLLRGKRKNPNMPPV